MYLIDSLLLKIAIGILTGSVIYWIAVNLFRLEEAKEVKSLFQKHILKKRFDKKNKQ